MILSDRLVRGLLTNLDEPVIVTFHRGILTQNIPGQF